MTLIIKFVSLHVRHSVILLVFLFLFVNRERFMKSLSKIVCAFDFHMCFNALTYWDRKYNILTYYWLIINLLMCELPPYADNMHIHV
jgi:hypothetical protein